MTIKSLLCIILIITVIMGCGATRAPIKSKGFSFQYEGTTYHIESMTPPKKEGYNMLVHKEGNQIMLRAIDKEQDGMIDEVVQGNISLKEADAIYKKGIATAKVSGNFKKRKYLRAYRTSDLLNDYELSTFILTVGDTYNRLAIVNKKTLDEETVVVDLTADGHLNKMEKGSENVAYYQKLYQKILDQGLKEGRIIKTDGMYQVALRK